MGYIVPVMVQFAYIIVFIVLCQLDYECMDSWKIPHTHTLHSKSCAIWWICPKPSDFLLIFQGSILRWTGSHVFHGQKCLCNDMTRPQISWSKKKGSRNSWANQNPRRQTQPETNLAYLFHLLTATVQILHVVHTYMAWWPHVNRKW